MSKFWKIDVGPGYLPHQECCQRHQTAKKRETHQEVISITKIVLPELHTNLWVARKGAFQIPEPTVVHHLRVVKSEYIIIYDSCYQREISPSPLAPSYSWSDPKKEEMIGLVEI